MIIKESFRYIGIIGQANKEYCISLVADEGNSVVSGFTSFETV